LASPETFFESALHHHVTYFSPHHVLFISSRTFHRKRTSWERTKKKRGRWVPIRPAFFYKALI